MSFGTSSSSSSSQGWSRSQADQRIWDESNQAAMSNMALNAGAQGMAGGMGQDVALGAQGYAIGNMGQFTDPMNPYAQAQVGQLGFDINRQLGQNMQAIRGNAIGTGALGGGRDQVARGLAGQSALDAFQRGATDIYSRAYENAMGATMNLAQLGQGYAQQSWMPLAMSRDVMGDPTTLSSARSRSSQSSRSSSSGFSFGLF